MDRREAIQHIERALAVPNRLEGLALIDGEALETALQALQESEIVRCKDCKHSSGNGKIGCVLNSFDNHQVHLYANDYCSRGTKKQVPKPYESEGEDE